MTEHTDLNKKPLTNPKSGIYLFYGEDGFSLSRKIERWKSEFVKKYSPSALTQISGEDLEDKTIVERLEAAASPSLFSQTRLVIAKNCLPKKAAQEKLAEKVMHIAENLPPDCFLIFWETGKLDKRLSFTKRFLALPINVTEFQLPHGRELNAWLSAQAKILGFSLTQDGAEVLAQFLGRDFFEEKRAGGKVIERKEFFDLWQAQTELSKLASFGGEIGKKEVETLVVPKIPENVFALSERILALDREGAIRVLEELFKSGETDEKGNAIKLVGLLSEQLRSLAAVSMLLAASMSQEEIGERLGWSSGRVFITAKNSSRMPLAKLKLLLKKLLVIEHALKSSDVNPRLLLARFVFDATLKA